ncbi:FHA domain-containing protein [Nostoc sp.]|uniref:FHA domain-containing protein n=1 Tax=Nostoc sp. TaxID=1180 RepID=UPI002FF78EEB
MNALTLKWNEAGKQNTKQIDDQQLENNCGTFRIGRDPNRCNMVLNSSTVSSLHIEIYFNTQIQRFCIRNLRGAQNPVLVNGIQLVQDEEFTLNKGSIIALGNQKIKIADLSVSANTSIDPTILPMQQTKSIDPTTNKSKETKSWQETTFVPIVVALLSVAGTWFVSQMNTHTEEKKIEAEKNKLNLELRAKKQETDEERFYKHQDKVREILIKNKNQYNKITLKNKCLTPVNVAASFTALDGISETRGWNIIPPTEDITPAYFTDGEVIFLYANTIKNNKTYVLQGGDFSIKKLIGHQQQFNYIADTFYRLGTNKVQSVNFYQVKFDRKNKDGSTTKIFRCDGDTLQLN